MVSTLETSKGKNYLIIKVQEENVEGEIHLPSSTN
jgi:hypothetical protein